MFTKGFYSYVCDGDTITCTVDGFDCTATVHRDDDSTPPWKREDGHGPVSEYTSRDKNAGERVLIADGNSKRYYDFAEAIKIAKRDGWYAEPFGTGTKAQRAERAVERDFAALKAWCDDEWYYVAVAVTVSKNGIQLTGDFDHACWGTECNYLDGGNEHLTELANEYLPEALESARAAIAKLTA